MKAKTALFGEIDVQPEEVFTFPHGLPGFEDTRKYIVIQNSGTAPFSYLLSVDREEDAPMFIITDPFFFYKDYEFDLPDSLLEELGVEQQSEILTMSIVSVQDRPDEATINLLAPIILNVPKKIGRQFILHNSNYRTKHSLMQRRLERAGG